MLGPHEYNGIAWYGDTVWTTYTGTDPNDIADPNDPQEDDPAVIWSTRIDWTWESP